MDTPGARVAPVGSRAGDLARVLLVTDNPPSLPGLEGCLAALEAGWVRVSSLREAAGRLSASDFGLAIVAVEKSDLDVDELAHCIRKEPRGNNLPILFITGTGGDGGAVERAYSLGAVDFVTRPIGIEALRSKVALFLEITRSRRPMEDAVSPASPAAAAIESTRLFKEIQQMGGAVGVESARGEGSRFWIDLEAVKEPGSRLSEEAKA